MTLTNDTATALPTWRTALISALAGTAVLMVFAVSDAATATSSRDIVWALLPAVLIIYACIALPVMWLAAVLAINFALQRTARWQSFAVWIVAGAIIGTALLTVALTILAGPSFGFEAVVIGSAAGAAAGGTAAWLTRDARRSIAPA